MSRPYHPSAGGADPGREPTTEEIRKRAAEILKGMDAQEAARNAWLPEDWRDLHEALERIKRPLTEADIDSIAHLAFGAVDYLEGPNAPVFSRVLESLRRVCADWKRLHACFQFTADEWERLGRIRVRLKKINGPWADLSDVAWLLEKVERDIE